MASLYFGVALIGGLSGTAGIGHTQDENGVLRTCITFNICGSVGAEASVTGCLGQSYTNATTSPRFSTTGLLCASEKVAAGIGGSVHGCQNSNMSQTYTTDVVVGGAAGASGAACYAVNYCW